LARQALRPRPISSFANASPSLLPSEKRTGRAKAQLRTFGLKPNYELWAKALLRTFGLKPNYKRRTGFFALLTIGRQFFLIDFSIAQGRAFCQQKIRLLALHVPNSWLVPATLGIYCLIVALTAGAITGIGIKLWWVASRWRERGDYKKPGFF
jgi:hypothetical protein